METTNSRSGVPDASLEATTDAPVADQSVDAPPDQRSDTAADGTSDHDAIAPDATDSGDASPDSPSGITVSGRVIDNLRAPAVGWQVELGSTVKLTDGNGAFTFDNVATPYDIAFRVPGVSGKTAVPQVWVYRGLTRPDPTLQCGWTLGPHTAQIVEKCTNVPTATGPDGGSTLVMLGASVGSPQGIGSGVMEAPCPNSWGWANWFGGTTLTETLHTLAWAQPSGPGGNGTDNQYLAYHETTETFYEGAGAQTETMDFAPNTVPTSSFSATVNANWQNTSSASGLLDAAVVFDSNGFIDVASIPGTSTSSPTIPMPVLPDSHVVFVAARSLGYLEQFGMAHRMVVPPATSVSLDIPEPQTLLAPADGVTGVDLGTTFTWNPAPTVSMFAVNCFDAGYRVVDIHQGSAQIPDYPALGVPLPQSAKCSWHVEVHGAFASVDDATGPKGMIDACEYPGNCENASLLDDGSLTVSAYRGFTTAP